MRVLLATDGTWGDVGPLLTIGAELRTRGHDVLTLLNPSFAIEAERLGLRVHRAGVPWEERLEGVDPGPLMRPLTGTLRVMRDFLIPEIPAWVAATHDALADFRPDAALVHHVCWGPLWASGRRGLPVAAAFLAPAVLVSADDPGRPMAALPAPPRLVAHGTGVALRALFRRILDPPARRCFASVGLPPPRDVFTLAQRTARISLALWSRHLRGPASDDPPGMRICGYAFPPEPDPLGPELEDFLRAGEAPVVVTLGSSARETGLEVYRAAADACTRTGCRAVLLTGGPANRPDPLPTGVAAFDAAPHGRILPRARVIIHHGGAGTSAQVLRSGRPSVIIPFGHDQIDNAYRAQKLGTARVVTRRRATAQRLARVLDEVLGSTQIHEAARRMGEMVRAEYGSLEAARLVERLG